MPEALTASRYARALYTDTHARPGSWSGTGSQATFLAADRFRAGISVRALAEGFGPGRTQSRTVSNDNTT